MIEIILPVAFVALCIAGLYWYDKTYYAVAPPPEDRKLDITLLTRPAVVERATVVTERCDTPRRSKRQRYVCGFAFHSLDGNVRPRVVLVRKVKPDWQAGKLNGVGGKIEAGESPEQAMSREFHEETGVIIYPECWQVFATMNFPKAEVVFLRCFMESARTAATQTVWSDEVQAHISEPIEHRLVRGIDEIPEDRIMPNIRWAIPMAFHQEGGRNLVTVDYTEHN
jgi:8-oxo-dGTP diphosphatase